MEKVTVPESTDSFGFDGGTLGTFSVAGGSVKDFTGLSAGQYTITEDDPAPAGYALTGISCVDSATGQTFPGDLTTRSVDLDLVPGERIHCIFTNTAQGSIVIRKATDPVGGTDFTFSQDVDGSGDFSLDDGGARTFTTLPAGVYTVVEADKTGYDLQTIVCEDSNTAGTPSTGDLNTSTATVNLDPGETVTCTFTNKQDATALDDDDLPQRSKLYVPQVSK